MNRIRAFFYALEYLNILTLSKDVGLNYLREMDNFRRKNPGVEYIIHMDRTFRGEIEELLRDDPEMPFPTALERIWKDRKDLWATAVCDIKTRNMNKRPRELTPEPGAAVSPDQKPSPNKLRRQKQNQVRKERLARLKQLEKEGKGNPKESTEAKTTGDNKKGTGKNSEISKLRRMELKTDDGTICIFYNTAAGCKKGTDCDFKHICAEKGCRKSHPYAGNH